MRNLLLFTAFLFYTGSAVAQKNSKWSAGIRAGMAAPVRDEHTYNSTCIAPAWGGYADWQFSPHFSIEAGINLLSVQTNWKNPAFGDDIVFDGPDEISVNKVLMTGSVFIKYHTAITTHLSGYAGAGIAIDKGMGTVSVLSSYAGDHSFHEFYWGLMPTISTGLNYHFHSKLYLNVHIPVYSQALAVNSGKWNLFIMPQMGIGYRF